MARKSAHIFGRGVYLRSYGRAAPFPIPVRSLYYLCSILTTLGNFGISREQRQISRGIVSVNNRPRVIPIHYRLQLFTLPACTQFCAPFLLVVRGTVKAVVRATSAGRMLILRRIIEQTRPAEKQQRYYNQMKTGSHLSRLCCTKVLC